MFATQAASFSGHAMRALEVLSIVQHVSVTREVAFSDQAITIIGDCEWNEGNCADQDRLHR